MLAKKHFALSVSLLLLVACQSEEKNEAYTGWTNYGGTKEMTHYSSLTEIDTTNVQFLTPAWTYHTGDADTTAFSQMQTNPIVIDGVLYGVSAQMRLFALDATNGKHLWTFDPLADVPYADNATVKHILVNSRGITYWADENGENGRIFFTAGSFTYAIDAENGEVITDFGIDGAIDLHKDLGRDVDDLFVVATSPGIVYQDLLIMGMRVDEGPPAAPGHIRAYDVRSGTLRWIFHTIPQPGEPGYDSWDDPNAWQYTGGANVWSGFSLDETRGLLFCGTGSATYDFYGGKRLGSNLYANCVLALDATTGKLVWHYQLMHHDVWDKDIPTPPVLIQLDRNGKKVDAVAQSTKNGMVYVFERETGKPIFDIGEIAVDTNSLLVGERPHPTQPVPVLPPPFSRQTLSASDVNPYLPDSSKTIALRQLEAGRRDGPFTLPGPDPWFVFPGFDGGGEWGGPAFDPETELLYVNSNEMAWLVSMLESEPQPLGPETQLVAGQRLYRQHCRSCHGADRQGNGTAPALLSIADRFATLKFKKLVMGGRRMMPAFARLPAAEIDAIATFVLEKEEEYAAPFVLPSQAKGTEDPNFMPYKLSGYTKFLSAEGMPAISPPWGQLTAIDLGKGSIKWQIPLGQYPEYAALGLPDMGTENYGGPVVTAGGLLFIAATVDGKFRAFNKRNGELLWEYDLPNPAFATPAMYELNGRQYLVIACGGGKLNTRAGDSYVAFALP